MEEGTRAASSRTPHHLNQERFARETLALRRALRAEDFVLVYTAAVDSILVAKGVGRDRPHQQPLRKYRFRAVSTWVRDARQDSVDYPLAVGTVVGREKGLFRTLAFWAAVLPRLRMICTSQRGRNLTTAIFTCTESAVAK